MHQTFYQDTSAKDNKISSGTTLRFLIAIHSQSDIPAMSKYTYTA